MLRSNQNLCLPLPLPKRYPISCPIICCTPPVNYPCMPRISRVQHKIICPSQQSVPKSTKTVVYLLPCPTCPIPSPPKMEMTYLPPTPSPSFYICNMNYVPCTPCPPPMPPSCNSPYKPSLCLPAK